MKSPLARAGLIAGAAFSLMATASFAQAPAAHAERPAAMKRQHDPAAHAQRLREMLQLTQAQEPALQSFIASHGQRGDRQARKAERQAMQTLTTPQRLDRMVARNAERQQRLVQRADAVKRFYAALSPAQQKAFDAMHKGKGGKHVKKGGHRGGPGQR
jgi:protein CpxP